MKKPLRLVLAILALGTTGLFAQAVTETPAPSTPTQTKVVKTAKKGHKKQNKKQAKKKKGKKARK